MIPKRERGARARSATMDHSDIRGLATALHHFFAGLPRSSNADHPQNSGCSVRGSHKTVEGSPHRSRASRCRFGMWPGFVVAGGAAPVVVSEHDDSGLQCDVLANVPDEACKLSGDGDADFVWIELAFHRQAAPAFGKAQLRFPGDVAKGLGLTLLTHFQRSGDLGFEAIGPGGLDEDA